MGKWLYRDNPHRPIVVFNINKGKIRTPINKLSGVFGSYEFVTSFNQLKNLSRLTTLIYGNSEEYMNSYSNTGYYLLMGFLEVLSQSVSKFSVSDN